jgi:hypothetical protein
VASFVFNPFTGNFDAVGDAPDPIATPYTFAASCFASDAVGDVVRISGPSSGGVPQVTKVDISTWLTMPGIGIITSKSTATDCIVAFYGAVPLSFALLPGRPYFASALSIPTDTRPATGFIQILGIALDGTRLFLQPSWNLTRVI